MPQLPDWDRGRRTAYGLRPRLLESEPLLADQGGMKPIPDDAFETGAHARGLRPVAGVDEAGRGPLAGPVVAAAVILPDGWRLEGLTDSKLMGPKRRLACYEVIRAEACVGIGVASVEEIDALNILRASHLAMMRALSDLSDSPAHVLIDGNLLPRDLTLPAEAIVGGDGRCLSIAAASIVAKTWRDRIMVDLAQQHPGYGWETNAGYPTKSHKSALATLGVTPHHRRSFAPVHNILYQDENATP